MSSERAGASDRVRQLAAAGRRIAAIKQYRVETGAGLREAKHAVEALESSPAPSRNNSLSQAGLPVSLQVSLQVTQQASQHAARFLAATLLGGIGLGVTVPGWIRAERAQDWPTTQGEIVEARRVHAARRPDRIEVAYAFEADDRAVVGSRISYTPVWGPFITDAVERRYPVGREIAVAYDPDAPHDATRAVLETEPHPAYAATLVAALLAFLWGATQWLAAARREREQIARDGLSSDPRS